MGTNDKNKSEIKKPTFEIASKDMTINGKMQNLR